MFKVDNSEKKLKIANRITCFYKETSKNISDKLDKCLK